MKKVNVSEFLKKDEALRRQVKEMSTAIMEEMLYILSQNGGEVRFKAVDNPANPKNDLVKGFRIKLETNTVQYFNERKGEKPMLALHNPYGHWYDVQDGYGFKTIRTLVAYLEILRKSVS